MREIDFLGHRVSACGISPLPDKVAAVRRFECPRSVKSLQRFLGLVNFYRRFLPHIAATVRPLTDALASSPWQLTWSEEMTSAFEQTKKCLADATLLVHPVPDAELRVNTDASSKAIAGAINQVVGCPRTAPTARVLQLPHNSCRITILSLQPRAPCSVFVEALLNQGCIFL